jgi:hypothetical protein
MQGIRFALFKFIRRLLDRRGFMVVPQEAQRPGYYWSQYMEIEGDYTDALYYFSYYRDGVYCEPLFTVDIEIVRNSLGFGFSRSGWHPFTATLEQYQSLGDSLTYEDSLLRAFYERYQPATVADVFSLEKRDVLPQTPLLYFTFPWSYAIQKIGAENELSASAHGWQSVGPVSDKKGNMELQRITTLYRSIAEKGYLPEDHIRGHFLKKGDAYRFIIVGGNHRAAALAALDYRHIPVIFQHGYPRVIDFNDVSLFRQVKNQHLRRSDAEAIFAFFFDNNGTRVARALGLLTQE